MCTGARKKVMRYERAMMRRQRRFELAADHDAVQLHRERPDRRKTPQLVGETVDDLPRQRYLDLPLLVEKRHLAQQWVFGRLVRRGIDDPDLAAEVADDLGQHPRIGRDASTLR